MKHTAKTISIIFVLLIISTQALFSQQRNDRHSLALWTAAGYSSINNHSPLTQARGGLGNSIGIGYEFSHRRGFLLQTGVEFSRYSSLMNHNDTLHIVNMISTTGFPYEGHFSFRRISDRQNLLNAAPVLLLGSDFRNGFFFLAGGKVMFNIDGTSRTRSEITKRAYFDDIIGGGGGGIGDMPNHGLGTEWRSHRSPLSISPVFIGSLEAGYLFPSRNSNNRVRYRLSVFADYGFSPANSTANNELIINPITTGEYLPVINGFLHHDVSSSFINTLFAGVRFTILFGGSSGCNCFWQR